MAQGRRRSGLGVRSLKCDSWVALASHDEASQRMLLRSWPPGEQANLSVTLRHGRSGLERWAGNSGHDEGCKRHRSG